jgi:hypothetical protein
MSDKSKSKIGSVFLLLSLIVSIAGLLYWIDYIYNASVRYDEAQKKELEARENLAQAYAKMPWTLKQIFEDIDKNVQNGTYSVDVGDWLKNRVTELRNP